VILRAREQSPDHGQSRIDTIGMHTNRLPGYLKGRVDLAAL
jgi:hypothetical protein